MKFPRRVRYMNSHGVKFPQARSAGCWTLPATASMFSGRLPHEHGATCRSRKFSPDEPTLAERLQAAGYSTTQITANVVTTDLFGLNRGFDRVHRIWDYIEPRFNSLYKMVLMMGKPRVRKLLFSKDGLSLKLSEDLRVGNCWVQNTHSEILDLARTVIAENRRQGKPGFLFLNLMETHFPYHVGPTFRLIGKGIRDRIGEISGLFNTLNQSFLRSDHSRIPPQTLRLLMKRQARSWRLLAAEIDEFVNEMHEDRDNLIIFCSDHGDNFGDQGWVYHFGNVTDAGNRVPLIWFGDTENDGDEINRPVSARHLYGSILNACGIPTETPTLFDERPDTLPIMEGYWYDSMGKTLPKYRHDQFCFVYENRRYVYRDGLWLSATVTNRRMETPFEPLKNGTDPIEELRMPRDRREYLRNALRYFVNFSESISTGMVPVPG